LIICSFVDRIPSARTAGDGSTNADVLPVCPTCAKPDVSCISILSTDFCLNIFFLFVVAIGLSYTAFSRAIKQKKLQNGFSG